MREGLWREWWSGWLGWTGLVFLVIHSVTCVPRDFGKGKDVLSAAAGWLVRELLGWRCRGT
jgi:hypothetical protein